MLKILASLDKLKSPDLLKELYETYCQYGQGTEEEKKVLKNLNEFWTQNGQYPDTEYLEKRFGIFHAETAGAHPNIEEYIRNTILNLRDKGIRGILLDIAAAEVIKEADFDKVRALLNRKRKSTPIDVTSNYDGRSCYEEVKSRPAGMKFFVETLDEHVKGMAYGSLTTIFGFTSHGKTSYAISLTYSNMKELGYNIAYVTLEIPKEELYFNFLARHASELQPETEITAVRIKKALLTEDEEEFLFEEVEPDFQALKGRIYLMDRGDLTTTRSGKITRESFKDSLEQLEDLDGFVIDYVNLMKYFEGESRPEHAVNAFVSYLQELVLDFNEKKLIGVMITQANREGWKKAAKKNGGYTLVGLAEFNQMEQSSYNIVSVFLDESLKASGEIKMQLLKNRAGVTIEEPFTTYMDAANFFVGDTSEYKRVFSEDVLDDLLEE